MKYFAFLPACALLLASCSAPSGKPHPSALPVVPETPTDQPLPPGTIVASSSMAITEDQLNHSSFTVTIKSTDQSDKGIYNILASFGNNSAEGQFTMPRGGENLRPLLHKGSAPYTFVIGFQQEGDDTFYDYYEVSATRGSIEMKYLKGYSFK